MLRSMSMIRIVPLAGGGTGPDHAPDDHDAAWADALAGLARTHRARLAAPDPSRPWLTPTVGPDAIDGRRPGDRRPSA